MSEHLEGFHGTSRSNANSIIKSKQFHVSGNEKDWLGRGIYFFEKDRHQAYMFAKFRNRLSDDEIAVIGADIYVEKAKFIDLLLDEDRKFIEEYACCLKEKLEALKDKIGSWNHKEGYVLDYLYKEQPYDVVRAAYRIPKKRSIFPHDVFSYISAQIQICVKESRCINPNSIKEVDCDAYRRIQTKSLGKTQERNSRTRD